MCDFPFIKKNIIPLTGLASASTLQDQRLENLFQTSIEYRFYTYFHFTKCLNCCQFPVKLMTLALQAYVENFLNHIKLKHDSEKSVYI